MAPEIKPRTPLSLMVYTRMKERGLSVHDLADATDVVYETMRGTVKGDKPPSKRRLREICRVLNLDFEVANEMLITEQMKRKYGRLPASSTSRDPELRSLEEMWQLLSPEEKEHVTWLVSRYVEKRTRKRQAPGAIQRIAPRPVRTS